MGHAAAETAGSRLPAVLLPLYVSAVALVVVAIACSLAGHSVVGEATTRYSDAGLYINIAEHGSTIFRCTDSPEWCGNAAWFPAFPGVMRAVSIVTRLSIPAAGALVALAFTVATLVLLWATFLRRRTDVVVALALLYAAFAPGQLFGYMAYPFSILAFLTILYLWLAARGRLVWAGVLAFAIVITYPVGICAPIAVAITLLFAGDAPLPERLRRILIAAGPAVLAIGALAAWFDVWTGHWDAPRLVGEKYRNTLQDPLAPIFHATGVLFGDESTLHKAPAAATLLSAVTVLAVLSAVVLRRRELDLATKLLAVWVACAWLLPLALARVNRGRAELVLLPVAALLPFIPKRLLIAITVLAVVLVVPVEVLFLRGEID
jgi:hypothetical protein